MSRAWMLLLLLVPQEKARDLSDLLKPIREKHDVPSLVALLVRADGTVVMQGADGVRRRGAPERVTIDDRFHLGSCTKSMTATMIESLVDEGKLKWETTISDVFKDVAGHPDWAKVTVEQLLTHRAGAPANADGGPAAGDPVEQRRALVESVLKNPPVHPPGTRFLYSNAGVSMAGAMAEKTLGLPWEDLMRKRLFEPLGLKTAGFGPPGDGQPRGHRADGTPVEPGPGSDNPAAIGPAGTVHMSLRDWGKYVAFHLKLKPGSTLHDVPKGTDSAYAKGWVVTERKWADGLTLMHNGSNTLWFAVVWMAPKKGFAVLAATNQGGDKAAAATDAAATVMILDYTKK